jgi:hypothetical protein
MAGKPGPLELPWYLMGLLNSVELKKGTSKFIGESLSQNGYAVPFSDTPGKLLRWRGTGRKEANF